MQFTANIDYLKLSKAFEKIPLIAGRELRLELKKDLKAVAIDARLHHDFRTKSGMLERSVQAQVDETGLSGKVFLDNGVASYGKYVHDGTKPHQIRPKNKGALHFVVGGRSVIVPKQRNKYWNIQAANNPGTTFSWKGYVDHPGTKKDQFLFEAFAKQKPSIIAGINKTIDRIFKTAGLK